MFFTLFQGDVRWDIPKPILTGSLLLMRQHYCSPLCVPGGKSWQVDVQDVMQVAGGWFSAALVPARAHGTGGGQRAPQRVRPDTVLVLSKRMPRLQAGVPPLVTPLGRVGAREGGVGGGPSSRTSSWAAGTSDSHGVGDTEGEGEVASSPTGPPVSEDGTSLPPLEAPAASDPSVEAAAKAPSPQPIPPLPAPPHPAKARAPSPSRIPGLSMTAEDLPSASHSAIALQAGGRSKSGQGGGAGGDADPGGGRGGRSSAPVPRPQKQSMITYKLACVVYKANNHAGEPIMVSAGVR